VERQLLGIKDLSIANIETSKEILLVAFVGLLEFLLSLFFDWLFDDPFRRPAVTMSAQPLPKVQRSVRQHETVKRLIFALSGD